MGRPRQPSDAGGPTFGRALITPNHSTEQMPAMIDLIDNATNVTQIFGEWPSFHDAEVHRLTLNRTGEDGPSLEVVIHAFKMTDEVTASGHCRLCNHTLITIRFSGVALEHILDFNHQNVMSGLAISAIDPESHSGRRLAVQISASFGMEAVFECTRCTVTDTRPYDVPA